MVLMALELVSHFKIPLVDTAAYRGLGWSTNIPNYNPRDIADNIRRLMKGQELEPMTPWYRGFKVR